MTVLGANPTNVELVVSVDNESYLPNSQSIARQSLIDFGFKGELLFLVGDSKDPEIRSVLHQYTFDFIHIDGDHTTEGCLRDLELCWPLLTNDGYIIVHDSGDDMRVKDAVNSFIDEFDCAHITLSDKILRHGGIILQRNGVT